MADTTFVNGTVVEPSWLNDVNDLVYNVTQTGTGAVPRSASSKLNEVVSVKDFGALGDGVSDDSVAIQNAINAVTSAGGGNVVFPPGTYLLNTGIVCTGNGVTLEGSGEYATIIMCAFVSGDIISIGDGTANPNNCTVSNLSITSSVSKTSGAAIRFRNGHSIKAQNIRMDANLYTGFQVDGGAEQFLYYIENFEINSGTYGIYCGGAGFPQDVWVSDGIISNCTNSGILLKNISGFYFTNIDVLGCANGVASFPSGGDRVLAGFLSSVIADTCDNSGFNFLTNGGEVADINMSSCWGSSCGVVDNGHGLYINGTVKGVIVDGCRFINNQGDGILISAGLDVSISNTQCLANSQQGLSLKHGLEIGAGVTQWSVIGGVFGLGGQFATNNQGYGILINAGASDNYQIIGANLLGNNTGSLSDGGTGTVKHIYGNVGYRTSNQGQATVLTGTSSVVVTHGLASTPARSDITLTPLVDPEHRYFVSASTSTTFTISMSGVVTADRFIGWSARIKGA